MAEKEEYATPEKIDDLKRSIKESNEERRQDKLRREVTRAHEWRVQVWAQMELKIRRANASLEVSGAEAVVPFEPIFGDDEMLAHYASMTLSK